MYESNIDTVLYIIDDKSVFIVVVDGINMSGVCIVMVTKVINIREMIIAVLVYSYL